MLICYDTETTSWNTPSGVPDLVCLTFATEQAKAEPSILQGRNAVDLWLDWIEDDSVTLLAHNGPFDAAVMAKAAHERYPDSRATEYSPGEGWAYELVWRAYEADRMRDTNIREMLWIAATGWPAKDTRLASIAKRRLGLDLSADKDPPDDARPLMRQGIPCDRWPSELLERTPWRFKYGLLRDVPLHSWPADALRYALEDPVIEWRVFDDQYAGSTAWLADERAQTQAAWDLHVLSLPGFRTDRPRARRLIDRYQGIDAVCRRLLVEAGLARVDVPPEHLADVLGIDQLWVESKPRTAFRDLDPGYTEQSRPLRPGLRGRARHSIDGEVISEIETSRKFAPSLVKSPPLGGRWPEGLDLDRCKWTKNTKVVQALVFDGLGRDAKLTKGGNERQQNLWATEGREFTDDEYAQAVKTERVLVDRLIATRGGTVCDIVDAVEQQDLGTLEPWLRDSGEYGLNSLRLHNLATNAVSTFLTPLDTDQRVRTSYRTLVDSGRTSSRRPNIQNYPRDAKKPPELSIRGCIVSDPGCVFVDVDYGQLELCCLAHILNVIVERESSLARAINSGQDCHLIIAAQLLEISYAEALAAYKASKARPKKAWTQLERDVNERRQIAKPVNYGFPGGMGANTFVEFAAAQGITVTPEQAQQLRRVWRATWPEMNEYFGIISDMVNAGHDNKCRIQQLYSNRVRGGCYYTEAANTLFQGLAADGCKRALRELNRACYRTPGSVLYGCKPLAFIHDEFLVSVPDPLIHCPEMWGVYDQLKKTACELWTETQRRFVGWVEQELREVERIMIEGMRAFVPDVKIEAEGKILRERWGK